MFVMQESALSVFLLCFSPLRLGPTAGAVGGRENNTGGNPEGEKNLKNPQKIEGLDII